jgi:hypothetical protein
MSQEQKKANATVSNETVFMKHTTRLSLIFAVAMFAGAPNCSNGFVLHYVTLASA